MKRSLLCVLILVCSAGSRGAPGSEQGADLARTGSANPAYDAPSFAVLLQHIAGILHRKPSADEMTAMRAALPQSWTVATSEGTYSISTEPLRNELEAKSSEKAFVWVNHLATEIEGFSVPNAIDGRKTRTELDQILKRPEFAGVRPPTPWEMLRQRISAWLERQLEKLFMAMGRHPIG